MRHPSQLDIFQQQPGPRLEPDLPVPSIRDLKDWRSGDLLDLLETICALVQSDEWRADAQSLLHLANDLRLPSSLTTLLLNSLPRLERLLGVDRTENEMKVNATALPNVAALAIQCGLGGVFTKDVDAIWSGKKIEPIGIEPHAIPVLETAVSEDMGIKSEGPTPVEKQYFEARITTNQTATGRQWKIAGQLVSEVSKVDGIGHVGKLYSGDHVTPLKPYSEYEPAATQCRAHAEGILKLLKTIPR